MKNLFSLSICLLFLICCKTQYNVVRKVDKEYREAPPGTVWIKDSIYMDQCEIRNVDYLKYVRWVKKYDSINYEKVLPDTLVWRQENSYNDSYVRYYLTYPAYRNYPVVGVSYEQAVEFCKWRTERVREFAKLINPKSKYAGSYKNFKYYYRLPTKEEWEFAASAGMKTPYGFESIHYDNAPCVNVKEASLLGYNNNDCTVPVFFQKPNKFGMYNMIGNVAEILSDKGISKGGSWYHSIDDCEITDSIKYDKPTAWLGFRCVCIVTK
jgi:formylglycine-generating enzyme required for sulfatase activity